jgi:hypothetical protein
MGGGRCGTHHFQLVSQLKRVPGACETVSWTGEWSGLGYNKGKGKTTVFLMRVTWSQIQCDFLPPVTTPYPLAWYHSLERVFQLYNFKNKKIRSRKFFFKFALLQDCQVRCKTVSESTRCDFFFF